MCVLALVSGVACLCLPGWDHSWGAASPTVGVPQCLSMEALFSSSCKAGLGLDNLSLAGGGVRVMALFSPLFPRIPWWDTPPTMERFLTLSPP